MLLWGFLIAVVAGLLLIFYLQFKWKNRRILEAANKLPCLPGLPVLGNSLLFFKGRKNISKFIINITSQFQELFCIWAGPVPLFIVSKPEDVQIVLNSSNTIEKDDAYQLLRMFLGNGLVTSPATMWKKYRRIISPAHHPNRIETYLPVFNDVSRQLTDKLLKCNKIDPRNDFFNLIIDASMKTLVDRDIILDDKTKQDVYYVINEMATFALKRLLNVCLHVEWIFKLLYWKTINKALKKTEECRQSFSKLSQESLARKLTNQESSNQNSEPETNLMYMSLVTPKDVTENHTWWHEIATMLAASSDSQVNSMSFFLLSIAIHQDVQTKIRNEIKEVMGDSKRDVTTKDIDSLTYLNQALMESMRFHGAFPVIARKATKDITLTSATLPSGSRIILPLQAMGWKPDAFPDPEKFQPDRFSPENNSRRHRYAFIPFSGGPRNCIAKKYAFTSMKTVLVHIIRTYKVKTNIRMEDIEYETKISMFSKTPLQLEFVLL